MTYLKRIDDKSMFDLILFPPSLMTVPFSCPIMEATWTWSPPWQSREMNWRDFRRKEGKITIHRHLCLCLSFSFTITILEKQITAHTQPAGMKKKL